MKRSLTSTKLLPESHEDAQQLKSARKLTYTKCLECQRDLTSPEAVHSEAGWRETQITGMCEPCFDDLFKENEQ